MESMEKLGKDQQVVEIAQLVAAIFREEKRTQEAYCHMGKLYAALHPADYESEYADSMAVVQEAEAKIAACQEQILALRETVEQAAEEPAAEAVAETPAEEVLVAEAVEEPVAEEPVIEEPVVEEPVVEEPVVAEETPVEVQPEVAVARCANCNGELMDGARFCVICGTPVQAAPELPARQFCTGCGAELGEGVRFCTACGKKRD